MNYLGFRLYTKSVRFTNVSLLSFRLSVRPSVHTTGFQNEALYLLTRYQAERKDQWSGRAEAAKASFTQNYAPFDVDWERGTLVILLTNSRVSALWMKVWPEAELELELEVVEPEVLSTRWHVPPPLELYT